MKEKIKALAEVIDLDFYRKFRVALPIRISAKTQKKPGRFSRFTQRRFSRRLLKNKEEE